jgi:hypothetical protein
MFDKKIRETMKHIIGLDLPGYYNCQRLPGVLINNCQNFDCSSIACPIRHKIIRPDMVTMRGPETDTGSVIKPQSTPFRLFLRNLQTLLTPDTLHPLVVYLPTIPSQQGRYPSISITAIPGGKGDNRSPQGILIISHT